MQWGVACWAGWTRPWWGWAEQQILSTTFSSSIQDWAVCKVQLSLFSMCTTPRTQRAPTLALLYSCIQLYLSPETQAGWQGVECRVHVGRQYGHCIHSTSHCFADSYFQHSATISRPSSILRETNLDSDIHQPTHGDHSVPSGYSSSELSDTWHLRVDSSAVTIVYFISYDLLPIWSKLLFS